MTWEVEDGMHAQTVCFPAPLAGVKNALTPFSSARLLLLPAPKVLLLHNSSSDVDALRPLIRLYILTPYIYSYSMPVLEGSGC